MNTKVDGPTVPDRRGDRGERESGKATAAAHIGEDLVSAGLVHPDRQDEAAQVVARGLAAMAPAPAGAPATEPAGGRGGLVELAGYLGGALVLAAFGLFLADNWADLGDAGQVVSLAVITALLAGAGGVVAVLGGGYVAMRSGRDEVRRRLTSALWTGTAVAAALTVGRVVEIVRDDFSSWPTALGGATMVVLGLAAYRLAPSVVAHLGIAFGALVTVFAVADLADLTEGGNGIGLLIFGLGVAWLLLGEGAAARGLLHEVTTMRAVGSALALFGAQNPLIMGTSELAYALTAAVAVAGFVMYLRTTSWPYLVAGVLAVTIVVPEAIIDWTDGSLGAGGAVLLVGLSLLGASAVGFRMRQHANDEESGD